MAPGKSEKELMSENLYPVLLSFTAARKNTTTLLSPFSTRVSAFQKISPAAINCSTRNSTKCVSIFLRGVFLDFAAHTFLPRVSSRTRFTKEFFPNSTFEFVRKIEASACWRGSTKKGASRSARCFEQYGHCDSQEGGITSSEPGRPNRRSRAADESLVVRIYGIVKQVS